MKIQIHSYTEADRALLIQGVQGLQDYVARLDLENNLKLGKDFDAETYWEASLKIIKEGEGAIFLAKNESGDFLGFIMGILYEKSTTETIESHPSREGKILELYVNESTHGQGIGKSLMNHMESYLKEKGATAVRLECLSRNPAHAFYLKRGYEDRLITLYKRLH